MRKRPDDRPGPTWFQAAELAMLLDITRDQFDRAYRRLVPESVKRKSNIIWIKGRSLFDAVVHRDVDKLVPSPTDLQEKPIASPRLN